MKTLNQLVAAVTISTLVGACGLISRNDPIDQTYLAAETYKTVQIAIEGYVTTPSADEGLKARLKQIDREMMIALENMRLAALAGDNDKMEFWSQMIAMLLIQVRTILQAEGILGPSENLISGIGEMPFREAA